MSAKADYPTTSPLNSTYLPFSEKRHFLSSVDFIVDNIYKSMRELVKLYSEHSFFTKTDAINVVQSSFSSSNFEQMPDAYRSPCKEKLEESIRQFTSRLSDKILALQLYKEIGKLYNNWNASCYLMVKDLKQLAEFSLESSDFIVANKDDQKFDRDIMCYDFAFYLLNETNAFCHIFNPLEKQWPTRFILEPVTLLKEWGYQLTTSPEAGDLVVYCTTHHGYLETRHVAIWLNDKAVVSKFGKTEVYEHPFAMVPISYGHFTYFFHKQFQSDLVANYTKELDAAVKGEAKFSHKACFSPLSLKGCKMATFTILRDIPNTKRTFHRGMYNREYHKELRDAVLTAIYEFPTTASKTKEQLLKGLHTLVLKKATEVKPTKIYGISVSSP